MSPRLFDPGVDNIAELAALHAGAFDDAWGAESICELFSTPGVFAFFQPGGFILARAAGDEAEILTLAVAPSLRRHGLGRALVRAAASHAQGMGALVLFLEVAAANHAAYSLYCSVGFSRVGTRKAYYGGQDADILKTALPLPYPDDFA
jgi:[ribosomal protein S18]-alanine N-acetyltransferase